MKKTPCTVFLAAAVLLGIIRTVDLCLFTEVGTEGFVSVGSAWQRYAVMAVFALALLFYPNNKNDKSIKSTSLAARSELAVAGDLALISGVLAAVYSVTQLLTPTTMFGMEQLGAGLMLFAFALRFILSLGLLAFGAWLLMLYKHKEPLSPQRGTMRTLGFCGVMGFFVLTILRYAEMPASVHHMLAILPIFSALSALIFTSKLLGTICVDGTAAHRHSLCTSAIFAFFMCTCIGLPQMVWQAFHREITPMNMFISAALGIYGVAAAGIAYKNAE
ncbi:MAG: hypothetical protein GXZ14_00420 [Ruminococcaceae bacterium]|nr:hypothetical protein [Oscillospiraceae bacterium]